MLSTVLFIDWKFPELPYSGSIMPKATQKSAHGEHNLLQEESEVPSSPEDTASSDQEIDQDPRPEASFHPYRAQQAIPTCSCHI